MPTVLVAGGAGFIGSHLCEFLLEKEFKVICSDKLLYGKQENIKHLLDNKNFVFRQDDILEPLHFENTKISRIYNFACPSSVIHYETDPITTTKVNTIGVMNLLDLAKEHNARILQASSSEIYGSPIQNPQKEDNYSGSINPIKPNACYYVGKSIAEALFFDYHRTHGLETKIARVFNAYGPRMQNNPDQIIPSLITRALKNEIIVAHFEGSEACSFCFVSDIVSGLYALMEAEEFVGPVNLGNPKALPAEKIIEKITSLTKSKAKIIKKDPNAEFNEFRVPDISLAKRMLGWQPKVDLEEGLEKTVEYFKQTKN